MEDSELFRLITSATTKCYRQALTLVERIPASELRRRTINTENTYLHLLVIRLVDLYRNGVSRGGAADLSAAVPLVYKFALYGVDINAQNSMGNTALHLACFRPYGQYLAQHLVRIGIDPGVLNKANCRVIHNNAENKCWMVRDQKDAKCSIWNAVMREDRQLIEQYLNSWCRVNTRRRRKTLLDVAYETGNYEIVQQLLRYRNTNELVCCAMACDKTRVSQLLALKSDKCNPQTEDNSRQVSKPLLVELQLLGRQTNAIIELLRKHNYTSEEVFAERLRLKRNEFENAPFYRLVKKCTEESLQEAWLELDEHKVNVNSICETDGGTYLHFLVKQYIETKAEDLLCKRFLIRLMAKLSLEGVNMHARNAEGLTVLMTAYSSPPDRHLLDHLIRLGVDSSIRSPHGLCLAVNSYATRGELILKREHDRRYLPGLFTAVEDGDLQRVNFWLNSMCRVEVCKNGRTLLELARDLANQEIIDMLEKHHHTCEFVAATMAADLTRMKHHIAMGQGQQKVNICFKNHFAGFTQDWRTESVVRPLIANVMEYGTYEICSYLIQFGARLDIHYDETAPCGPVAFWAFRDEIQSEVTLAIAKYASLHLRNEQGATLLHAAVIKRDSRENKHTVIQELLSRGINVAARNIDGLTARDMCCMESTLDGDLWKQMIDDYVLNLSYVGDIDAMEQLIVDGYDHLLDIRGTERNKTAVELATLRYFKELLDLLAEVPKYQQEIVEIHQAVVNNDLKGFSRLAAEKRVPWGVDKRGRNILHMAVLFQNHAMVSAICEQFPIMVEKVDNLQRSPVHYAVCLRDQRFTLSIISTLNSVDMNAHDANNMTALDYIEQMERPTPRHLKKRGRRFFDYQVRNVIELEKQATIQSTLLPKSSDECKQEEYVLLKTRTLPPQHINLEDIQEKRHLTSVI